MEQLIIPPICPAKNLNTKWLDHICGTLAIQIFTRIYRGRVQGRRISNSEEFKQVGVIPGCIEAFSLDSALAGFLLLEHIESDSVEQGEVLRRVSGTFAAEVFAEADIEHPV